MNKKYILQKSSARKILPAFFLLFFIGKFSAQNSALILYNLHGKDTMSFHFTNIGDHIKVIFTDQQNKKSSKTGYLTSLDSVSLTLDRTVNIIFTSVRAIGYEKDFDLRGQFLNGAVIGGSTGMITLGFLLHEIYVGEVSFKPGSPAIRAIAAGVIAIPSCILFAVLAAHKFHLYKLDSNTMMHYVKGNDYERMRRRQFFKDIGVRIGH
ncbi:MAG: hypothetical protein HY064_09830 [Bacteroidetes bacterium]|nr:hypothetical protein [Bacteroidota bacterium]